MTTLVMMLALTGAQDWTAWEYMGVHGGEYVAGDHTAIVVQCSEEAEQILVTVHVPHEDDPGQTVLRQQTLYLQLDGGETQTIEKTEDRPFPGIFQFEPEEWFVDFLLAGGHLEAVFQGVALDVPLDSAFMKTTLDHCTGGAHAH